MKSDNSVRKYRKAWQHAIDKGWAEESEPGARCVLPDEPFEKLSRGAHVSNNTGENEWYTPAKYVEAAREVMGGIDLDPASCEAANATVNATQFYSVEDDGLLRNWAGNVWMNPPYSHPLVRHFCERLTDFYTTGNVAQAVVLVNNATDTGWFQALASVSSALCFPKLRIGFWQTGNTEASTPLQGQAFLYLGDNRERFSEMFSQFGIVLDHSAAAELTGESVEDVLNEQLKDDPAILEMDKHKLKLPV